MSQIRNITFRTLLPAAMLLSAAAIVPAAQAGTLVDASPAAKAAIISKQQAETIAVQAAGGGTVLLAVLERENHAIHWSIDIRGAAAEYEVWISTGGTVLKIITQPL